MQLFLNLSKNRYKIDSSIIPPVSSVITFKGKNYCIIGISFDIDNNEIVIHV